MWIQITASTSGVTYVEPSLSDINYLLAAPRLHRSAGAHRQTPTALRALEFEFQPDKAPVINPVFTGVLTCDGQIIGGTIVIGNAGTFSTAALPDGVSFADLVEAIGDDLIARPKLDFSDIPCMLQQRC